MAITRFVPTVDPVAQVSTFEVTANDAASTYTVSVGDWSYSTVGLADADTTAADLAAAIDAASHAHASPLAASAAAAVVTVTGQADGLPFDLVVAVSGGTGTVSAVTESQAAQSRQHWNVAANWSEGAVPVNGDEVDLSELQTPILWGLEQASVALAALRVHASMSSFVGLDPHRYTGNADGSGVVASEREYRTQRLRISWDRAELGIGDGNGAPRLALENTKAGASLTRVRRTAVASWRSPLLPVDLKLADASAVLQVDAGLVSVCDNIPGETGACAVSIPASGSSTRVHVGGGVSVASWEQRAGDHRLRSAGAVATVAVYGGELLVEGDFAISSLALEGGEVVANHRNSAGDAIAAATLRGGVLDGARSAEARIWDQLTLHAGAQLRLHDAITLTAFAFGAGPVALVASRP